MSEASLAAALKAEFDTGFDDTTESSDGFAGAFAGNWRAYEFAVGDAILTVNGDPSGTFGGTWADRGAVVGSLHAWERTA